MRKRVRPVIRGEKGVHRLGPALGVEGLDFIRAAAEAGPVQQVGGLEEGPLIVGLWKHGA